MKPINRQHSWFELCFITIMVMLAAHNAFVLDGSMIVAIGHCVLLISCYLLIRVLARRIHEGMGRFIFALATLLLTVELLLQYYTGLHTNWFVISLLLQENAGNNIGISLQSFGVLAGAFLLAAWYGNKFLHKKNYTLNGRVLLAILLAAGFISQAGYAVFYFTGTSEIMSVKRSLPFFAAPHPHVAIKLLTPILGKRAENPFSDQTHQQTSLPKDTAPTQIINGNKNLLLIVMDSLRAADIAADPNLAPNIMAWAQRGSLNLQHYSVANCTHFSFYSLLTGQLPTGFSEARHKGYAHTFLHTMQASGWNISTSEASELNWYDLATTLLPASTSRTLAPADKWAEADSFVLENTIEKVRAYTSQKQPFAHLAYFYGSHYPYWAYAKAEDMLNFSLPVSTAENYQLYLKTIQTFDAQFGTLMTYLEQNNLLENTLVILTADHGEAFNEDGIVGHGNALTDTQVMVPFLVVGAGSQNPKRVRSHVDVPAFVLNTIEGKNTATKTKEQPIILANCSYDYPHGFAVLENTQRVDFDYDEGYLTPLKKPASKEEANEQAKAAAELLGIIRQDAGYKN
ncbi:sulfatase-like hydrolase/transferase [Kordiimonas pumila]|uniref:Sulfatase-like hydrolase/transferase n=1 Tax=Kordiimonas pumila TaxID=2161677 RepID=A0ABV7DA51_9PROT|nr:sulfatase-like hydrolase/transferase [Kordiimonas pumila]